MGVFTFEDEHVSAVPTARLYNALLKHSHTILPKVIPDIKNVELVEGTGGPGSVIKVSSVDEGGNPRYGLHKVEVVDEASYVYNYSIVEGNILMEPVEKISFETKIVEGSAGGSVIKVVIKYHTKGDASPPEEMLKIAKEKGGHLFKSLEGYIAANPDLC
ncbi:class 10 plant pathogenesis-related protein 2E-like [Neltuma alba]|uniref:class 10 plant pathogenesis-related protein 2E-like n=1 Tax=Neltuma alba TaxID=207710 RepID=UPI0010A5A091|nr:class 10 plant pathogenesis-related protein 2E-like [Prosopis alba]